MALKHALRQLARSPGFSAVAILMLALGIGMSTAAFSVTNGILLKALPFPAPDRLIRVFSTSLDADRGALAPGNFLDVRSGLEGVAALAACVVGNENVAEPGQPPEQQLGMQVSAEFLRIVDVQPMLGRDFASDEDQPGRPGVVLLTYSNWQRRFGGDPAIVGKPLHIGTSDVTVIGVLPAHFERPLLWHGYGFVRNLTIWGNWPDQRKDKWVTVMGRLAPGVTMSAAQARLATIAARLSHDYPHENGTDGLRAADLGTSHVDAGSRQMYWLAVGLAAFVLAIACANLAGVQLARAFGRQHELAVRSALGASRIDLVSPLLTEALVLTTVGTSFGLLLAWWANRLISLHWGGIDLTIDAGVLAFTGVGALLTVATFGLAPAWLAAKAVTSDALKESSRGSTAGLAQRRLKYMLVVGQLALALVLVSSALSLVFAARAFFHRHLGWQPQGLVTGVMNIPFEAHMADTKNPSLARKLRADLGAIPGVERVSIASGVPVYGYRDEEKIVVEGQDPLPSGREPIAFRTGVDRDFFGTMGIALREGRLLPANYRAGDPHVLIINAAMAQRYWPGQSPLGKRIRFAGQRDWYEIIGVVDDASFELGFGPPVTRLQMYLPIEDNLRIWYNFVLKTGVPAATLLPSIRKTIAAINPDIVVSQIGDASSRLDAMISDTRMLTTSFGAFATIGLLIALIGLYGVISQLTQHRRREIGIRLALGADYRHVLWLVLRQAGVLILAGTALGVVGCCWVGMLFHQSAPELPPPGSALQLLIAIVLGLAGLAACYGPARRAARTDPVEVLRAE